MIDFSFEDENDDCDDCRMTITINDKETKTFIEKKVDPDDWRQVLVELIFMLNGCGYIIDPIKAEELINEMAFQNKKEFLK